MCFRNNLVHSVSWERNLRCPTPLVPETSECRHQVVCLKCSCVGPVAARCPVEPQQSPHWQRLHVSSKKMNHLEKSSAGHQVQVKRIKPRLAPVMQRKVPISRASLSLSLSLEISNIWEESMKVACCRHIRLRE